MIEFRAWPKIPRLFRDVTITEKLDGTNAAVHVKAYPFSTHDECRSLPDGMTLIAGPGAKDEDGVPVNEYLVAAQSRKRLLRLDDDNFGFAAWVSGNAPRLVHALGEGIHYGEWWGHGIQRGYGMPRGERRFSLFNTSRHQPDEVDGTLPGLSVVPIISEGVFSGDMVRESVEYLRTVGSLEVPGYMRPEGVVVYHQAANSSFKVLLDADEQPKTAVGVLV